MTNKFNVLLPKFLPTPLTYENSNYFQLSVGDFVKVQLGGNEVIGVIWSENSQSDNIKNIKPILSKENTKPLSDKLMKFIDWVAKYTMSSAGMILKISMSGYVNPNDIAKQKAYKISDKFDKFKKLTDKQSKVIQLLANGNLYTKNHIRKSANISNAVIAGMIKKSYLEEEFIEEKSDEIKPINIKLYDEQIEASDFLTNKIEENKFSATLLDGVTGSGKTEVYFSVIEKVLSKSDSSQILIMLPEIALTSQIIERFKNRFGFEPASWHSALTKSKRQKNWNRIINGKARIVIGARSALFLPFNDLRLVIIDEEHDSSYKQEEVVIYNARDMAIVRAKIENISVILASATPSIETIYNIEQDKYDVVKLTSRYGEAVMPDIKLVDMRAEKLKSDKWLSKDLIDEISKNLENKKQSLLFLNRKGYAPLTLCRECGYRFQCPDCSTWLVEHRNLAKLVCHHCGYAKNKPKACPECSSEELVPCGPGIERVEEEVSEIFPNAKIAIISGSDLGGIEKASNIISSIENGEIDIIIGTQVIAKGYNFPKLELVGIIDADIGLEGGDLRAAEQTYQLLQQVSGRAGRVKNKGLVIIQSYMPENSVIQSLKFGDRDQFLQNEIESRRVTNMPPFSKMVGLIISGKNAKQVYDIARNVAANAPLNDDINVMGPVEAPIYKLRNNYRYRLLVKCDSNINIQKWINSLLSSVKKPSSVMIKVDVDPYNFM